jgi:hypothetical protein
VTVSTPSDPSDREVSKEEEKAWNRTRSGNFVNPVAHQGWPGIWYACSRCDYQERAMSDGLLVHDYCPHDGESLRQVRTGGDGATGTANDGQDGAH